MAEPDYDNPAGRLLAFLVAMDQQCRPPPEGKPETAMAFVAQALNVNSAREDEAL